MDGFEFPVEVVRTKRRKSMSMQIDSDLIVKVRAPRFLSDAKIRSFIVEKTTWIKSKLREQAAIPVPKPKEYVSGECFAYLGRNYRLKVVRSAASHPVPVKMRHGYLVATVPEAAGNAAAIVRGLLADWYRSHAQQRLEEKTARLAKVTGVAPGSVSVRNYKARWGSCSVDGHITYNWQIILAPHRIVDYVVIHELCHLLEHNHSPRYWRHVERCMPDWRQCRDWLRANPLVF